MGDDDLTLRIDGIHDIPLGTDLAVDLDADALFVFDLDGTLRVAPWHDNRGPGERGGLDGPA